MDNPGFGKNDHTEKGIELSYTNGATTSQNRNLMGTCKPEVCKKARQIYTPPDLSGSPWHLKKTIFLIGIIVLLILWIIIFVLLKVYKCL